MGIILNTNTIETVCRSAAPTGKQARQEPFDNLVACMKKPTTTESEMRQAIKVFRNERSMSWPHCIIDKVFNKGKMQEAREILINIEVGSAYQKAAGGDNEVECVSEATVYRAMDPESTVSNSLHGDECILAQRNANDVEALCLMAQYPNELTHIFGVSDERMYLPPNLATSKTPWCFDAKISVNWPNSPLDKATFRYSTTDFAKSKFCETYVVKNSDTWIEKLKDIINSLADNHSISCKDYLSSTTQLTAAKARLETAKKEARKEYTDIISVLTGLLETTNISHADLEKARASTERYKTLAETVDTLTRDVNSKEQTCLDKATVSKSTAETLNNALLNYRDLTQMLLDVKATAACKSNDEIKANGGNSQSLIFRSQIDAALQQTATRSMSPSIINGFGVGTQKKPSALTVRFLSEQMNYELKRSTNDVSKHTNALLDNETWTKHMGDSRGSYAAVAEGISDAIDELSGRILDYNTSGATFSTRINQANNAILFADNDVTEASQLECQIIDIIAKQTQQPMGTAQWIRQPTTLRGSGSYFIKASTHREQANTASQPADVKDLAARYISKCDEAELKVIKAKSAVAEVNSAADTVRNHAVQMNTAQWELQKAMAPYKEREHIIIGDTRTNQPEVMNGDVSHQPQIPQVESKFISAITALQDKYNIVTQKIAALAVLEAKSKVLDVVISQLTDIAQAPKSNPEGVKTAIQTPLYM